MGRVKLKIKRLENSGGRTVTYTKRRAGILKKAKELSILCDIDIALLMFSPSGRPTLCLGERSTIEGVIAKFAQLTPQERAKRKLESLEALKKTFKKLDHDVNIQDFLGTSTQTAEELSNQSRLLQSQLSDVYHRLSYWTDPDKINNIEHIETMEESLKESLSRIRAHKENMEKEQLMSLECTGQFQTGMHLPLPMGIDAQSQALSWLPNNDGHPLMLHEDPSFLPQRDIDCSLGTPFPNYACYLSSGKQAELDRSGQESGVLTELKPIECSRLQLGGQYPYESYNLHMIEDKKFKTEEEINIQEPTLDYQVAGFEPPRIGDDASHRYWASTSSPCGVAMFHEPSYPQQHN